MAKTATVRARIEPDLKHRVEHLFSQLGITTTEAITLYYRQVDLHRGLPFPVRVPNAETVDALRPANRGRDLTAWDSLEKVKTALG